MADSYRAEGGAHLGVIAVGLCVLCLGCKSESPKSIEEGTPAASTAPQPVRAEPIRPLVKDATLDPARIALGQLLFHDARLSVDGSISCATCHDIATGGDDGLPISVGAAPGTLNSPTVLNSSLNFRQFWDGRAATLEEQVSGPLEGEHEMATTWEEVLEVVNADPKLKRAFGASYSDGVSKDNIAHAIAEYERSLITPNSPFDRWLLGEDEALDDEVARGYAIFKDLGCITCHQGAGAGGNMYQKMGLLGDYYSETEPAETDRGRFNVTGKPEDMFVFKVPSLRNVELTAPYFHDGKVATLEEAVVLMAKFQLGRTISDDETGLLVAFLNSLTGEIPSQP